MGREGGSEAVEVEEVGTLPRETESTKEAGNRDALNGSSH